MSDRVLWNQPKLCGGCTFLASVLFSQGWVPKQWNGFSHYFFNEKW